MLEAAETVFSRNGNGATIEDVAREAGVGVGTVCRHFPTKQALLDEVLNESYRELLVALDAALGAEEPAAAFDWYVHQLAAQQAKRRALAEQMASELVMTIDEALKREVRTKTAQVLERAQAAGAIRDDISPADTSMLFAGIAQITAVVGGDQPVRDRYVAVMLDGLRPAAATPLPGKPLRFGDLDRLKARQGRSR
ncbi:MAG TPA: TetR/AcrR family transcriptional regulator [Acidimicrobiales bacterium]